MGVETIRMSSKGQIVIPRDIREDVHANEGTVFSVISNNDTIILKKIEVPSKEDMMKELEAIAKEGRKRAEKLGIRESDVPNMVDRVRKARK